MDSKETKTILLVEDEYLLTIAGVRALKSLGYEVVTAKSGEEAVKFIQENESINLILMDIDLGKGIDGTEAAKKILEIKNIPIIFHTSHSEKEFVDRVKKITRYGYVIKDSSNHILQSSIEMAFELFEALEKTDKSEKLYHSLFENMINGFAYCKMVYEDSIPVDFTYLAVNNAFVKQTGLTGVVGKRVTEVIPGIRESDPGLFAIYGRVALTGNPESFEIYLHALQQWFTVSVYSPQKEYFVAVFDVITERKLAEENLRVSEESLSITLQSIGDAVIATDLDGRITRMNAAAEKLTGWSFREANNQKLLSVFNIVNSITRSHAVNPVENVIKTGEISGLANHTVLISRDGKEYQIADSAAPIKDRDGVIKGVILVFSDVTEKYAAEKALRDNEIRLRAIFEQAAVGIAQINSYTGEFILVNHKYADIIGYSLDEMTKTTFLNITHPDDLAEDLHNMELLIAGAINQFSIEKRYYRKDNSIVWVNLTVSPLWKKGETPNYHIAIVEDITDKKEAEEALKGSEARYKGLLRNLDAGIVVHAPDTSIIMNNPRASELLGLSESQMKGMVAIDPYWKFIDENKIPIPLDQYPVNRVIAKKHPLKYQILGVVRPDISDVKWLIVNGFPFFSKAGEISEILISFIDITERKQAEDQIKSLLLEKEIILKEVHHRIKNNMSTISAVLTLQMDIITDSTAISALQDAANRVQSMMVLYDKLYQSAKYNEMSVKRYLPSLIEQIIKNFPNSRIVKTEVQVEDFILDSKKLSSIGIIINELLTNIMKYAFIGKEEGIIKISVSLQDKLVVLTIQDNGRGLPETVDFQNSTGFGLTLVSMLTKQIGGKIFVKRDELTKIILQFTK